MEGRAGCSRSARLTLPHNPRGRQVRGAGTAAYVPGAASRPPKTGRRETQPSAQRMRIPRPRARTGNHSPHARPHPSVDQQERTRALRGVQPGSGAPPRPTCPDWRRLWLRARG